MATGRDVIVAPTATPDDGLAQASKAAIITLNKHTRACLLGWSWGIMMTVVRR